MRVPHEKWLFVMEGLCVLVFFKALLLLLPEQTKFILITEEA